MAIMTCKGRLIFLKNSGKEGFFRLRVKNTLILTFRKSLIFNVLKKSYKKHVKKVKKNVSSYWKKCLPLQRF